MRIICKIRDAGVYKQLVSSVLTLYALIYFKTNWLSKNVSQYNCHSVKWQTIILLSHT